MTALLRVGRDVTTGVDRRRVMDGDWASSGVGWGYRSCARQANAPTRLRKVDACT